MPPRKPVGLRQAQEPPTTKAQPRTKEEKININGLAEKLLTLAARASKNPPSDGKQPLEWFCSLTLKEVQDVLVGLYLDCVVGAQHEAWLHPDRRTVSLPSYEPYRLLAKELGRLTEARVHSVWDEIEKVLEDWYSAPLTAMESQGLKTHEATLAEEDDRIISKQGTRYVPLSLAAEIAQVPRTTLVDWIKTKKFAGLPLQTYNSPTAHKVFLSEQSVQTLANRFVKWNAAKQKPSGPAGPVKIARTFAKVGDQSGYIGLPKAAKAIGADYHTLWLWATQGKESPASKSLDVIQDTATEQFYIRQKDVTELKLLIPKSGLRRGRRPQDGRNFNTSVITKRFTL